MVVRVRPHKRGRLLKLQVRLERGEWWWRGGSRCSLCEAIVVHFDHSTIVFESVKSFHRSIGISFGLKQHRPKPS